MNGLWCAIGRHWVAIVIFAGGALAFCDVAIVEARGNETARIIAGASLALVGAIIAVAFVAGMSHGVRQRLRELDGDHRCSRCGYDLRASPYRCPECGTSITK